MSSGTATVDGGLAATELLNLLAQKAKCAQAGRWRRLKRRLRRCNRNWLFSAGRSRWHPITLRIEDPEGPVAPTP
jgi:hypothetical protein